jgi:hypothetical protein
MPVMGWDAVAEATKCTGEPTDDPAVGLVTVTPAKANAVSTLKTQNRRAVFFQNVCKV